MNNIRIPHPRPAGALDLSKIYHLFRSKPPAQYNHPRDYTLDIEILGSFPDSILDFSCLTQMQEHFSASILLGRKRHTTFPWIWWSIYILISDMSDFKQNYIEAWRQHQEQSIIISLAIIS